MATEGGAGGGDDECGDIGDIGANGVCDGNVLKYCDRDALEASDCAERGGHCVTPVPDCDEQRMNDE